MFRNAYQHNMLTVFYSCGSKPLAIWDTYIKDGYITRFMDQDIKSTVLEIGGTNVSTTFMICPKGNETLGITMPFLVMIVKNLKKYFTFEVTALDESNVRRRFRVSNFQSTTQILPMCTVMPIGLSDGWNQIQFNLAEFMRRAYKKQFIEVQKLKINANIRLRRIYFTERLMPEDQLPPEYKLYFPLASVKAKGKKTSIKVDPATLEPADAIDVIKDVQEAKKSSKESIHSKRLSQLIISEAGPRKSTSLQLPAVDTSEQQKEAVIETVVGDEPSGAGTEVTSTAVDTEHTEASDKETFELAGESAPEAIDKATTEAPDETAAETLAKNAAEASGEVIEAPDETAAEAFGKNDAEASGEAVEASGEAVETSGGAVEASGETVEASGEAAEASGEAAEASGEATSEAPVEASAGAPDEVVPEETSEVAHEAATETPAQAISEATDEASAEPATDFLAETTEELTVE